jgi:hypothetical protein
MSRWHSGGTVSSLRIYGNELLGPVDEVSKQIDSDVACPPTMIPCAFKDLIPRNAMTQYMLRSWRLEAGRYAQLQD